MKKIMILHRLVTEDKERMMLTAEIQSVYMNLFLKWIKFNTAEGMSSDDNFLEYAPTYYLTNISDFHQLYYGIEEDRYFQIVPKSYVKTCLFPLNSNKKIVFELLQRVSPHNRKSRILQ